MKQRRTVFFVSDQTGVTAETMGHSLLTQFDGMEFRPITLPFITTVDKAREAVAKIDQAGRDEGIRPIVFATLVNDEVRDALKQAGCLFLDFFDAFLGPLEQELGQTSAHVLGRAHGMADINAYTMRINATNFALANDDGAQTRDYERADVILVGVSRSGKTPTCVYMALQYGAFAANYPAHRGRPRGLPAAGRRRALPPEAVRPHDRAGPAAADPAGTPARQPLRLRAAVRVRGACSRAVVRPQRHPVSSKRRIRPSRRSRAACSSGSPSRGA